MKVTYLHYNHYNTGQNVCRIQREHAGAEIGKYFQIVLAAISSYAVFICMFTATLHHAYINEYMAINTFTGNFTQCMKQQKLMEVCYSIEKESQMLIATLDHILSYCNTIDPGRIK